MERSLRTQCPYMYTLFCASECDEDLPCLRPGYHGAVQCRAEGGRPRCSFKACSCWSGSEPPLTLVQAFIAYHIRTPSRVCDEETAYALGRAVSRVRTEWAPALHFGQELQDGTHDSKIAEANPKVLGALMEGLTFSYPHITPEGHRLRSETSGCGSALSALCMDMLHRP